MNFKSFNVFVCFVLLFVIAYANTEKINFENNKESPSTTKAKKDTKTKILDDKNTLRAASTCLNCDCQCDSYRWTDKNNRQIGNCRR